MNKKRIAKGKGAGGGKIKKRAADPAQLIWHIVDWEKSFEPDDAMRRGQKTALAYVKLHIKGRGGLSGQQLDLQRRLLLGDPGGIEAWSVYSLCCIVSGNRGEGRGYLWNDQEQPANAREIGVMIGIDAAIVRKALPLLKRRHFMEKLPVPAIIESYVMPIPDSAGGDPAHASGAPAAASCAGDNCNGNGNDEQQPQQQPQQQPGGAACDNPALSSIEKEAAAGAGLQNGAKAPTRAGKPRTTRPPAQQAGSGAKGPQTAAEGQQKPPETGKVGGDSGSSPPSSPDDIAGGDPAAGPQDPPDRGAAMPFVPASNLASADAANLFGQAVCLKLDIRRTDYHREHASIVTAWHAGIAAGLDKNGLSQLWKTGIDIAGRIRQRKKQPRKPGAIWWKLVDGKMGKQIGEAKWAAAKKQVMDGNAAKRLEDATAPAASPAEKPKGKTA